MYVEQELGATLGMDGCVLNMCACAHTLEVGSRSVRFPSLGQCP